ncbi:MAG: N-acetylmuramoyl-L-alanine amidase, partial [Zoogloeaceae bacterium]|nr:N-acetylmuramoyl-L-alanine amidase [Zoogloeaceae bacterium]
SNPEEERKLSNESYQNKLAEAISRGIMRYIEQNPPNVKSTQA